MARFLIEFVRINPGIFGGLSEAQVISIVLMVIGGVMLAGGGKKAKAQVLPAEAVSPRIQEKRS
jgi:prolipoprotein diacylglyceryltransferase